MVSAALEEYLAAHGEGETFDSVLNKPPIKPPPEFDGSQPITHYFISSSHNTYLLANQLWGAASPRAYASGEYVLIGERSLRVLLYFIGVVGHLTDHTNGRIALQGRAARAPARCVEIDVWYSSKKGPIVTHGHTFTGSIPFKDVCQSVGDTVSPNDLPVFVSLECHVDAEKQGELIKIMEDVWGEKLLKEKLQHLGDRKASPDDLRGKIVMMVEWYPSPGQVASAAIKLNEDGDASSSSSDSEDSDNSGTKEMKEYRKAHKNNKAKISDALAKLGIYANSIKPNKGWLDKEIIEPTHALINISESALLDLLKDLKSQDRLIEHARHHVRRCYPMGLRVNSVNMDPMPIWRCGTHVAGMNMQAWDKGTHVNGALFRDTQGFVLKPMSLLGGPKRTETATLKLTVIGGDDIPSAKDQAIYLSAKLYTHNKKYDWRTKSVKDHKADPMFDQSVEWTFKNDDLIFLKLELREDEWGRDDELASYTLLLDRIEQGLRFWPLFDNKGMPSQAGGGVEGVNWQLIELLHVAIVVYELCAGSIFIAEFQATKGNIIAWSLVSDETISLENVEFNALPSGVHAVDKDVIYITKDTYQGVAVYRRIPTDEEGMRGARMISVGVLVTNGTRPRPWNHISALKRMAARLEDNHKDRKPLEEYFELHKASSTAPPAEEPWNGWEEELSRATMEHPAFHLSHVLHIMGISSLTLFKHALGRRRVLIYTSPPVESACLLTQLAAVISTGEEGTAGVHTQRISVLGVVGLTDLSRIEKESSRGNGWIACTTDAIFLEKPDLYDLLIDLTSPSQIRPHRPALSVSRPVESNGARKSYKLQTVRFTWSDVRLWNELERILEADSDHSSHSHSSLAFKTPWTDPWGIYEDVCMVCAGIWVGWKPNNTVKLGGTEEQALIGLSGSSSDPEETLNSAGMSSARTRPSTETKKSRRSSDPRMENQSISPTMRAKVTTLSLLSAFHNHTDFLLSKLSEVLATAEGSRSNSDAIVLSPKEVMAFDLGPGSDLDARFVEWLGETRGIKVKVKRGWKDLIGFMFGFP